MNRSLLLSLVLCPSVSFGQQGAWEDSFDFGDVNLGFTRAVNLIHVWDGSTPKVLALSRDDPDSRLWTPPPVGSPPGYSGVFEEANVAADTFCGGHSALDDGRILHVGGRFVTDVDLFNPWEDIGFQWNNPIDPPNMMFKRWYPTVTTLADGRVLVTGGHRGTYDRISGAVARPEVLWYITGAGSGLVSARQAGCGREGART